MTYIEEIENKLKMHGQFCMGAGIYIFKGNNKFSITLPDKIMPEEFKTIADCLDYVDKNS